jgi:hypothetical protein
LDPTKQTFDVRNLKDGTVKGLRDLLNQMVLDGYGDCLVLTSDPEQGSYPTDQVIIYGDDEEKFFELD